MGGADTALIARFLGHLITADGAIHSGELAALEELLRDDVVAGTARDELNRIIADAEDKVPSPVVLQHLAEADAATQEQALVAALAITYSDGFLDPYEERIIEAFLTQTGFSRERYLALRDQAQQALRAPDGEQTSPLVALLSGALRPLVARLAEVGPQATREQLARLETRLLLAGPEYERAIARCATVAHADFALAEGQLSRGNGRVAQLSKTITALMRDIVQRPELQEIDVRATLLQLRDGINERLLARVERQRESLVKRRRALDSYTITFVGRTKAGKSTLHSIITGEGSEAIGVGLQRTTRYNRVYSWKRLRIIDTPGIGAPGGQSDEAIAESILDESDVICYVVTNDSIQEAEFQFLGGIRARGKPVIILLNVKENIADERRLRIFLKHPHRWHERTDEQAIAGHIERIRRYARAAYGSDRMPIFPVHLLAARLAREGAHREHASTLNQASRLQPFLDALRVGLIEEGPLRRSQTMLDGTTHTLDATRSDLAQLAAPLRELREKLSRQRAHLHSELRRGSARAKNELRQVVGEALDQLTEEAYAFARDHHDDDEAAAAKAWERELQRRGFVRRLQDEVVATHQRYFDAVRTFLDEATADLDAFADLRLGAFTLRTQPMGFDVRLTATIGSIVTGVGSTVAGVLALVGIATGPVGWICAAAAVGFGFLGGFFDSASERRRKAIARLHESLRKGIERQRAQTLKDIEAGMKQTHDDVERRVTRYFDALTAALDGAARELAACERAFAQDVQALNAAFARRALAFARGRIDVEDVALDEVRGVERELGVHFTITARAPVAEGAAERLSAILQERVSIVAPRQTETPTL